MLGNDVFKHKSFVPERLADFGFVAAGTDYVYSCPILQGQFHLNVFITEKGDVRTQLLDAETGDEYILHLLEGVDGRFVGEVRSAYLDVLRNIADKCCEQRVFQSIYADKVIQYIRKKYQDELEYLWEKSPENAIVRRADNKKWYAAFLTVRQDKIGLNGHEKIEVIDLRMKPEEIDFYVDGKKYFSGYHMNKKHWVTLCLDGSVCLEEILQRLDDSYVLAKK